MEVVFGGTNINAYVIERILNGEHVDPSDITPESISAGYARISRSPKSATELREEASREISKARKSNETIVFGIGHHSVAEHPCINLDVIGISRLALEALESHRIGVGYTEKSQRYITLKGDYVTPKELDSLPDNLRTAFPALIESQNKLYNFVMPTLLEFHRENNPGLAEQAQSDNKAKNTLEGFAKEDARYVLSLSTEGQLGFTANFRTLEYIIRQLRHHPLAEVRELSDKFYNVASEVAPSLIKLCDAQAFKQEFGVPLQEKFVRKFNSDLKEACRHLLERKIKSRLAEVTDVNLLDYNPNGDAEVIAGLIMNGSQEQFEVAYELAVKAIESKKAKQFLLESFKELTEFDKMPREFELSDFTFELLTSASAFAQLKRHRMMTLLPGSYNPDLGYTIPESVSSMGLEKLFIEEMDKASDSFYKAAKDNPWVAQYFLTNGHRRLSTVKMNLRELYAFSRLRQDSHAQWDIRNTANKMTELAQRVNPLTTIFLGGKDQFPEIKRSLYGNE